MKFQLWEQIEKRPFPGVEYGKVVSFSAHLRFRSDFALGKREGHVILVRMALGVARLGQALDDFGAGASIESRCDFASILGAVIF